MEHLVPGGLERLEMFLQVHASVKRRHLLGIAVERQCLALGRKQRILADAPLGRLAPAWMVHGRIDVGIKPVFAWARFHPCADRLLLDEADAYDGLDALEAVLPRHHQSDRRAILVWQHLAV